MAPKIKDIVVNGMSINGHAWDVRDDVSPLSVMLAAKHKSGDVTAAREGD